MNAANIFNNAGSFYVIFGWMDGLEFRVSPGKPGRHYVSLKNAQRAALKWEQEN